MNAGYTNSRPERAADGVTEYCCTKCGDWKPVGEFRPIKTVKSKSGRHPWCRGCENVQRLEYKLTNATGSTAAERQRRFRQMLIGRGWMLPKPVLRETSLPPLNKSLYGRQRATRVGKGAAS